MQGLWNLIGKVGQGPGRDFAFEIGEKVSGIEGKSVWTLHKGKRKGTLEEFTIFACDAKESPPDEFHIARNALKRLRSLRHPNILKFIDGFESDAFVYVVTEPVVPLCVFLQSTTEEPQQKLNLISWGMHQVSVGVSFLVNDCNLLHTNMNIFSVFVDAGGEWKLSGIEYVTQAGTDPVGKLSSLTRYDPPEGRTGNTRSPKWACDAWGLGCLIWEVFNDPLNHPSDLKTVDKIPKPLLPAYCQLVSANPKSRKNPSEFVKNCTSTGSFMGNDFVKANLFLQEVQIKAVDEQKKFFESLDKSLDTFSKDFCVKKMLPQLLNAFEFGAAGSSVLGPLFKVGRSLDEVEYQKKIVPCIVKLFSSNDRATRIGLLQQMHLFIHHVQTSIVNDQIFPNVATGFGDTVPAMREQTVKAMLYIVPKLSEKTISNNLMRYFAKLQMDEQPGIRTNTTICLGKVATHLPLNIRQRVLAPAFMRALKDPFPPARSAGISAMASCHDLFSLPDIAGRLLPSLCSLCIDPEKDVRDNAFKVLKAFLGKLENESNNPGSTAIASDEKADGSSSSWTGWAVNSVASRFYTQKSTTEIKPTATSKTNNDLAAGSAGKSVDNKKSSPTLPHATKSSPIESNNRTQPIDDHSDYDDAWSDDQWTDQQSEDDLISSMRNDILSVKQDLSTYHEPNRQPKGDNNDDSDQSDYGDWGAGDWENDDLTLETSSKSPSKNQKKISVENTKSMSEMLGMDTNDNNDFFADINPIAATENRERSVKQPDRTRNTQTNVQATKKPSMNVSANATSTSNKGWEDDDANWGTDDWSEDTKKPTVVDRQQELIKKREERRRQREEANKERKAAKSGSGAMKLGAVKKIGKGD